MYDTVIIGGGVIGLAILRSALLAGYNAVLFERDPHLCNASSGRNSGILCTGVDAPSGSLEKALLRDSISNIRQFCREMNVPTRECGSLVCLWSWDGSDGESLDEERKFEPNAEIEPENDTRHHQKLLRVLHESQDSGDTQASILCSSRVSIMEPSLSSKCMGAVHIPGEIVVDPWLLPLAYAVHSRELGKRHVRKNAKFDDPIQTGREVVMDLSSFDSKTGHWKIVTRDTCQNTQVEDGTVTIHARSVINAAGIDLDSVQSLASSVVNRNHENILPPPDFEARPRRGQYMVYSAPADGNTVEKNEYMPMRPIQPVSTDKTKGIFVYSTLYDQIVVGPTAKDQSSRTDDEVESDVSRTLANHASRVLGRKMGTSNVDTHPDFDPNLVGEYVGIRPGTTKRDYQIHLHHDARFITVGGIRSTGLTASLGIGQHVVQCLLSAILTPPELSCDSSKQACPTPLPDVKQLIEQYHKRRNGTIEVQGYSYKVTHPLTKFGWEARTGIAQR
ncbi:hypothetical protein ACHAW6_009188 [Cyclotella cf. meneghiniana]